MAPSLRHLGSSLLPGVGRLRRYERRSLPRDALAGITVTAYLIPQVMGYAAVAGVPVAAGLWSMVFALAVYVIVGSSPQLSVGPESTTALMTATIVAPLAAGDPDRYLALTAALALVVAAVCVVGWAARAGFLADLFSRPVLVGYMAGLALLMIAGQLGRLTGVRVGGEGALEHVRSFIDHRGDVHGPTTALALATLAFLLVAARTRPRWPLPLIGVLAATVVVAVWSLDEHGISLVGQLPGGLPKPAVPDVSRDDLVDLVFPAVGVAIVSFTDNTLTARAFAARHGEDVSANQELLALGAANVAAGTIGGVPVSSSASRTAVADSMGGATSMCSVVAVVATAVVLLAGRGILADFPSAALGAVVVYAALKLIDVAGFRSLARFRRSELVLALATTAAVLVVDVLYGVLVAVGLSIADLVRRVARPHDSVVGYVPGVAGMHDIDDYPDARFVAGLVVYRYDAPLCFANAEDFRRRAIESLAVSDGPVEWFLLNAEASNELDTTGLDALDAVRSELEQRGIVFAMARVKQDLRDLLERAGFIGRVGADRIFFTLPTAIDAYAAWYRERHGTDPARPVV